MSEYTAQPFTVHAERLTAATCEAFWRLAEDADGCDFDTTPHGDAVVIEDDDTETLTRPCPHTGCVGEYGTVDEGDWLVVLPTGCWSIMRDGEFRKYFTEVTNA